MKEENGEIREFAEKLELPEACLPLLRQALTHKSAVAQGQDDNERLEFLGDSILGMLINEFLYNKYPERSEGELTRAKAAIVSEPTLADAAVKLDIGSYLRMSKGEEISGGRFRPSMLSDTYEAVVAAIYLSVGIEITRRFVLGSLAEPLESIEQGGQTLDHKSALQEVLQERHRVAPNYVTVNETGPDHDKTFVAEARLGDIVLGSGNGHSKKEAEQAAAKEALDKLLNEEITLPGLENGGGGEPKIKRRDIPCISWRPINNSGNSDECEPVDINDLMQSKGDPFKNE